MSSAASLCLIGSLHDRALLNLDLLQHATRATDCRHDQGQRYMQYAMETPHFNSVAVGDYCDCQVEPDD